MTRIEVLSSYNPIPGFQGTLQSYQIAEWLEAQPLAQRVRGSIPLFGQNVKSGKPFQK